MNETVGRRVGLVVVTVAALAVFPASGDFETTLFMVGAVVGGLLCFDVALDRHIRCFAPWLLLSLAPAAKTVPSVWLDLRTESVQWPARYQHLGSLLLGLAILGAVGLLAVPAARAQNPSRVTPLLAPAVAATTALSGATVGFRFERAFGTVAAARLLETATWAVIGGLLAVVVLSAAVQPRPSPSLVMVQLTALTVVGLLAYTVAGRNVDRGWWAIVYASLAWGAVGFGRGALGTRGGRVRVSRAPAVLASGAAIVAATVAISARADRSTWRFGWPPLAVLALGLLVVALIERAQFDAKIVDVRRAAASERRAREVAARYRSATDVALRALKTGIPSVRRAARRAAPPASGVPLSGDAALGAPVLGERLSSDALSTVETVSRLRVEAQARSATRTTAAIGARAPVASAPAAELGLSARSARTDVDTHLYDPATGLLSTAGLQGELQRAFDRPRAGGEVTLLLVVVRNLDHVEAEHGRVRSAMVTSELADRLRQTFALGVAARFARNSYAILVEHVPPAGPELPRHTARLLVRLSAPVVEVDAGTELDLVAGMAQSRDAEDLAGFVARANGALATAVRTSTASLVALP